MGDARGETVPAVAPLIDHTLLRPDATGKDVARLCDEAVEFGFAAVCVNAVWVPQCAVRLSSAKSVVCTVVGFPLGATLPEVKEFEARRVLAAGAREVDMVLNIGALRARDLDTVRRDVDHVVAVAKAAGGLTKVILEAALLTDEEKTTACTIAREAGADYVKTSTGFGPGGATVADVALMRRVVGPGVGVKASGGIRDLDTMLAMVRAGATRIGTSAGVHIVREAQTRAGESSDGPDQTTAAGEERGP